MTISLPSHAKLYAACASVVFLVLSVLVAPLAFAADKSSVVQSVTLTNPAGDVQADTQTDLETRVAFDTTGQGVVAGDTFTVIYPTEFMVANTTFTIPANNPDGTPAGGDAATCEVTSPAPEAARLVCTFTSFIESRPDTIGEAFVISRASQPISDETVPFVVGDTPVNVDLPGQGGVAVGTTTLPTEPEKRAEAVTTGEGAGLLHWWVSGVSTGGDFVVVDTMPDFTTVSQTPHGPRVGFLNPATYDPAQDIEAQIQFLSPDQFTLTNVNGVLTATVPNSQNGFLYRLDFYSAVENNAQTSDLEYVFNNVATVNGAEVSAGVKRTTVGGGNATGTGLGGFTVTKDGTGALEGSTQAFNFTVSYQDASGQPVTTNHTAAGDGGTFTVSDLSKGTVVTVTEVLADAETQASFSSTSAGFTSNGGNSFTVTIAEDQTIAVTATNFKPVPVPDGSIDIAKTVSGSGAALADSAAGYPFVVSYEDSNQVMQTTTVAVQAGATATIPSVRNGSVYTVVENLPAAPSGAQWGDTSFTGNAGTVTGLTYSATMSPTSSAAGIVAGKDAVAVTNVLQTVPVVTTTVVSTVVSTQPTTVVSTQPTTVVSTQPTTVVSTQPTTVVSTQPTTVVSTQPTTVVSTQPTTVVSTQPTTVVSTSVSTQPTTIVSTLSTTAVVTTVVSSISQVPTTLSTTLTESTTLVLDKTVGDLFGKRLQETDLGSVASSGLGSLALLGLGSAAGIPMASLGGKQTVTVVQTSLVSQAPGPSQQNGRGAEPFRVAKTTVTVKPTTSKATSSASAKPATKKPVSAAAKKKTSAAKLAKTGANVFVGAGGVFMLVIAGTGLVVVSRRLV